MKHERTRRNATGFIHEDKIRFVPLSMPLEPLPQIDVQMYTLAYKACTTQHSVYLFRPNRYETIVSRSVRCIFISTTLIKNDSFTHLLVT